jgi:hypothetical protein
LGQVRVILNDDGADPFLGRHRYFKYSAAARFRSLASELAEKIATLFEDSPS